MRAKRLAWLAALLVVLLAQAGCSDGTMAQVSGTVTLDGNAIESGQIQFSPVDGKTKTAGGPIKDGQYSVGVPVGLMKVSISAPKVVGKKKIYDTPDSPEMPITKEALPAHYNEKTELQFEVKPGSQTKDFPLTSKK
jgi:hypothetical protein